MTTQVDNPTTVTDQPTQAEQIEALSQYRYGWHDSDLAGATVHDDFVVNVIKSISSIVQSIISPIFMRASEVKIGQLSQVTQIIQSDKCQAARDGLTG